MQRMGSVLGIKPEAITEYKRIHADVWPEVLAMIAVCNIGSSTSR
jgi:L-rhamnose mutarotase